MIVGENGIVNKAIKAGVETQLATIEEEANLIYMDKMIDEEKNIPLKNIVPELLEKNYNITSFVSGNVTGITLDETEKKIYKQ